MNNKINFLSSLQMVILENDLLDKNGKIIGEKGSTAIILPQTVAEAVIVESGRTLAEVWPEVCKKDHAHIKYENLLADYQAELVRLADRLTQAEIKFATP